MNDYPPPPQGHLIVVMNQLAEQLEAAARTDATRRQLIDERTHTSYVTPKAPTDAPETRTDDVMRTLHERITRAARKITILAPTHTKEVHVVKPAQDVPTSGDRLTPAPFLEAYQLLHDETYGSGAIFQDDTQIHGTGKAQRGRVRSDEVETRGGAIQKKKLSASQKNVIKSQRAFNEKTKIDKRLRKIGKEIYDWLNKEKAQKPEYWTRCSKCKKHTEDDWQYCPRCGAATEKVNG